MNLKNNTSHKSIQRKLKELSNAEASFFAWTCALRVLPFLGIGDDFCYWKKDEIQTMLKKTLECVDYAGVVACTIQGNAMRFYNLFSDHDFVTKISKRFHEPLNKDVYNPYDGDMVHIISTAKQVVDTVTYAGIAASKISGTISQVIIKKDTTSTLYNQPINEDVYGDISNIFESACNVAENSRLYIARNNNDPYRDAQYHKNQFIKILLDDCEIIKQKQTHKLRIGEGLESLWDNLEECLNKYGCSIWVSLYRDMLYKTLHLKPSTQRILECRFKAPSEIIATGPAAVAKFIEHELHENTPRCENRIIILGDTYAGKTSLARKLIAPNAPLPREGERTEGVDIDYWFFNYGNTEEPEIAKIHIWDFAGHVVTHAAHRFFMSSCIYIIVCNYDRDGEKNLEYWMNQISTFANRPHVFVVTNLFSEHQAKMDESRLKRKYRSIKGIVHFSISDDIAALEGFRDLLGSFAFEYALWKNILNSAADTAKGELEKYFYPSIYDATHEFITSEEFEKIAKDSNVRNSDIEDLRHKLHRMGICLYYGDLINEMKSYILNPNWITNGIYALIEHARKSTSHDNSMTDTGVLFRSDVDIVLKKYESNRFPSSKHSFLLKLMQYFGLLYPLEISNKKAFVIPVALPQNTPEHILKIFDEMEADSCERKNWLFIRYLMLSVTPPDIMARFIIKTHRYIASPELGQSVWKKGVVLSHENTTAIISEYPPQIDIMISGENKAELKELIEATFEEIFKEYRHIDPTAEYEIYIGKYLDKDAVLSLAEANALYKDKSGERDLKFVKQRFTSGDDFDITEQNCLDKSVGCSLTQAHPKHSGLDEKSETDPSQPWVYRLWLKFKSLVVP